MEQRSRFALASKTSMELRGGTGQILLFLIVVRAVLRNGRPMICVLRTDIDLLGHGYML